MANPSLSFSSPVHHGKEGEEILITACRLTTVYCPKKNKNKIPHYLMNTHKTRLAVALALAGTAAVAGAQVYTNVDAYAMPTWHSPYAVEPILSAADQVPRTSNPQTSFQMVGIPDGLGIYQTSQFTARILMNHEFSATALSRPIIGESRVKGAFVSSFLIDRQRRGVVSGDLAFTDVFVESAYFGPIAREDNATPAFARFCSGAVAGAREGFDRWIYFAGEEAESGTFDPRGGSAVAVFDGKAHVLPGMGHLPWENLLPMPRVDTGLYANKTVIMLMEDGPASAPYCGMFMYVGTKNRKSTNPLERNGLVGGQFYVLRSLDEDYNSEPDFYGEGSAVQCEWVRIPNAGAKTYDELKNAAIAQDFFRFSRPEDGAWSKTDKFSYYFLTTGGDTAAAPGANKLGRMYQMHMDPANPLGYVTLEVVADADHSVHADLALSPDNLDTSARYIMIDEDGHASTRPVMAQRKRDGSIWRYDLWDMTAAPVRVAALTAMGRDGVYANPGSVTTPATLPGTPTFNTNKYTMTARGIWESSGVHETSSIFGDGTFVFDVQAHGPTSAPGDSTVEDGQLLILIPEDS
jgi:hypothetical protein